MNNSLLQPADLSELFLSKEALIALGLSLKMAQQIVLKNDEIEPDNSQFLSLPAEHVMLIKNVWATAHDRQPELTWKAYIDQLTALLNDCLDHVVTLRLAYRPTLEQLTQLTTTVRQMYSPTAVVDLAYQPDLIAGCVIEFNGQRLDYSIQTQLAKVGTHE